MDVFFYNDTATTEIYTLSLHDALPIYRPAYENAREIADDLTAAYVDGEVDRVEIFYNGYISPLTDRKSTRLNSSHANISYAVFCLKKLNAGLVFATLIDTDQVYGHRND